MKRARIVLTPPDFRARRSNFLWGGMLSGAIAPVALLWFSGWDLEHSSTWALFALAGAAAVPLIALTWFDARYTSTD